MSVESSLNWCAYYFGRLRIRFEGVELPWRSAFRFAGSAVTSVEDDPDNDQVVTTIDGGGVGSSGQVIVSADADHTLSEGESAAAIVKLTGARTVDRQLVYPAPATNADAFTRILRNETTGEGNTIVTIGAGVTWTVPPGCSLTLGFDPDGVFPANTGAPA